MSELDGFIDGAALIPDRTTAEIIADTVAANPRKHNVSEQERIRRAGVVARTQAADDDWQDLYELRCRDLGFDPNELMPGNRPRYTMDEFYALKDHETGETFALTGPEVGPMDGTVDQEISESQHGDGAGTAPVRIPGLRGSSDNREEDSTGNQGDEDSAGIDSRGAQDPHNDSGLLHRTPDAVDAECPHTWPQDPEEIDVCSACGLTFKEWCES